MQNSKQAYPSTPTKRRAFIKTVAASAATGPIILKKYAHGAGPNDRIVLGAIGMGNRGRSDLNGFLRFPQVQAIAVCDVVGRHAKLAKQMVDKHHGNNECKITSDFRDVVNNQEIDAVLIATPDHWHAVTSIEAMKAGKDVFCEKPETLTVAEGRQMANVVKRCGRVFSGGSQRVWGDFHWYHKMVQGGAIGEVKEAWVNVGGPSGPCLLPAEPTPQDVDWDMWLGPAPKRAFHSSLIRGGFRPYRDYSGGGMTDWGCHGFGGALFTLGLHESGPVKVVPPDGNEHKQLTYYFKDGTKIYHGGGKDGIINFRGSEGLITKRGVLNGKKHAAPKIRISNYKGRGGFFGDFLHCVKTRETPFRSIERAHRTATVAHLGNIAYWLNRPLKWDAIKEQIVDDDEANRWLSRPMREPWNLS